MKYHFLACIWPPSHCVLMTSCLCKERERVRVHESPDLSSSSYKDTSTTGSGLCPWSQLTFNTSLKDLLPNTVTLRIRTSTYEFGGRHNSVPNREEGRNSFKVFLNLTFRGKKKKKTFNLQIWKTFRANCLWNFLHKWLKPSSNEPKQSWTFFGSHSRWQRVKYVSHSWIQGFTSSGLCPLPHPYFPQCWLPQVGPLPWWHWRREALGWPGP